MHPAIVSLPNSMRPVHFKAYMYTTDTRIWSIVTKLGKLNWYKENTALLKRVMQVDAMPYCRQATALVRRLGCARVGCASLISGRADFMVTSVTVGVVGVWSSLPASVMGGGGAADWPHGDGQQLAGADKLR